MVKDMPENFTLEFEVVTRYRTNNLLGYNFMIYKSANPRKDIGEAYLTDACFRFDWAGCSSGLSYITYENGEEMGKNEDLSSQKLACSGDDFEIPANAKFSLWRQKNRLRLYLNEEKVLDIPQAFNSTLKYNVFKLGAKQMNFSNGRQHDDQFFVSNFRYAVGAPDTRSKLITTGKFSTTGILFDVNSDKINPSSYGTLKEIATVLKENPTVKVKIIGHTDSDGDAAANVTLSQKRAAAVKETLSKEFGIDGSRLQTDGKGAAEPAADNTSAQGKANNRRVEFIKL
jgi:outer membrane protein OmpA-like peptidoglycan-associated protein